jgi:hypothetical protein
LQAPSGAAKQPFPDDVDERFFGPAIEATLEAALDACPNTSMILDYEVDCAELPCMVWLSVQQEAAFPPLPSCDVWSRAYTFDAVTEIGDGHVNLLVLPVFPPNAAPEDFTGALARRTEERQSTMFQRFRP